MSAMGIAASNEDGHSWLLPFASRRRAHGLVVTGKARGKLHAPIAVANWLLWDPAHWGDAAQAVRRSPPPRRACALWPSRGAGD
jgi:hypothetical protein